MAFVPFSNHLGQSTVVAHNREDNLLTNLQRSGINTIVQRHDLSNRSSESLSQVVESVTRLNVPRTNSLAERIRADRDVNNLARVDQIDILNLRVRGNDSVKGDVERLANSPETVALTNIVGRANTRDASLGDLCGWGDAAGLVVGVGAVLGNDEDLAELDEVDVLDVVDRGDVADTRAVLLGDGGEGVAGNYGVVDGAGGAADVGA